MPRPRRRPSRTQALGNRVRKLYDVGVAGVHRLLAHVELVMEASVIIAIAGMEGALASVVGGPWTARRSRCPPAWAMEPPSRACRPCCPCSSCASGISVVNIDNGFGAGYLASMINHMEAKP